MAAKKHLVKRFIKLFYFLLTCFCVSGCRTSTSYNPRYMMAITAIGFISILFVILAKYSNMLRDEVNDCDEFNENLQKLQQKRKWSLVNKDSPYSLAKMQFGLWTVIISSSFIYLSLFRGDCAIGAINKTALVLMGIFAGTAAASTLIDKREMNDNRPRHQNTPSEGFFVDILSDDNGISMHRFQNLVWTIVAVMVYLYKLFEVRVGCELPELSDTLLALTGISSATYIILRSKENDPPVEDTKKDTTKNVEP